MICWWSSSATWSRKKRCPVIRWRSTDWSGTKKATGRLPGHYGCVDGRPRKTGTATCSTPTSVSPAACTLRAIERTVHALIVNGFNPKSGADPYNLLVYTSFQERATRVSHSNVGRMAARDGDQNLARICGVIAGDEARHEAFYTRTMGQVLQHDPAGGILAFRSMLRGTIAMPGRFMDDGRDPDLFDHFAVVAQRTNVYTVRDYASIIEHLVKAWDIAGRSVTGEAARAQEELCREPERYERLAERTAAAMAKQPPRAFSWIRDRTV